MHFEGAPFSKDGVCRGRLPGWVCDSLYVFRLKLLTLATLSGRRPMVNGG
jgi:hypothetical protein